VITAPDSTKDLLIKDKCGLTLKVSGEWNHEKATRPLIFESASTERAIRYQALSDSLSIIIMERGGICGTMHGANPFIWVAMKYATRGMDPGGSLNKQDLGKTDNSQ
jgi:hypothetical protein